MPRIRVHEKALAHLSRGLYRSPASALRELVSNAWDASASEVRIDTNPPHFAQLSIQDNGDGFSRDEFVRLMEGGIGNSGKNAQSRTPKFGRPLIGRLGIGMLGIAQVCGGFTVISRPRHGSGFRATVTLYDLIRERLDRDDDAIVHIHDNEELASEVDVGEYKIDSNFDSEEYAFGTLILTNDVHPAFISAFRDTYTEPPLKWRAIVRETAKKHTIQELGDYWRLLWELSAACPVMYIDSTAVPEGLVRSDQQRLKSYNFRVIVDGIDLRKPVYLKGNPGGYTTHRIEDEAHRVFGRTVRFHGYIVVQEGKNLRPDELRGVLVRIKQVAVGLFDASLLDYRFNEGPRSRWVTAEVFADEGLEDALNIDRDSFNRFHPQFRIIQQRVHALLRQTVFPKVYKQIEKRSAKRGREKSRDRRNALRQAVRSVVDADVRIGPERRTSRARSEAAQVLATESRVEVRLPDASALGFKKANRELAAAILAIFEVSQRERSVEDRRRVFTEQLLELLSKW